MTRKKTAATNGQRKRKWLKSLSSQQTYQMSKKEIEWMEANTKLQLHYDGDRYYNHYNDSNQNNCADFVLLALFILSCLFVFVLLAYVSEPQG